jgi:hypothetical protein
MRVFISATEFRAAALVDLVSAQNVAGIFDVRAVSHAPPRPLAGVYRRPPQRLWAMSLTRALLGSRVSNGALLILADHDQVNEVQTCIQRLQLDTKIERIDPKE